MSFLKVYRYPLSKLKRDTWWLVGAFLLPISYACMVDDLPLFVIFVFINRIMYSIYLLDKLWIIVLIVCIHTIYIIYVNMTDISRHNERTTIICIDDIRNSSPANIIKLNVFY